MTAEEVFSDLNDKYGDAFNWRMIPLTNKTFAEELKKKSARAIIYITSLYGQLPNAIPTIVYCICLRKTVPASIVSSI